MIATTKRTSAPKSPKFLKSFKKPSRDSLLHSFVLADQALVSGSNFLLGVLLTRKLPPGTSRPILAVDGGCILRWHNPARAGRVPHDERGPLTGSQVSKRVFDRGHRSGICLCFFESNCDKKLGEWSISAGRRGLAVGFGKPLWSGGARVSRSGSCRNYESMPIARERHEYLGAGVGEQLALAGIGTISRCGPGRA